VGLLSLLGKVTSLSIKSEPKILTADNVEAEFFDGQDIPSSRTHRSLTWVARRRHLTTSRSASRFACGRTSPRKGHQPDGQASGVERGSRKTLFGGALVDRRETTTQITLVDGRTFMISGILRQADTQVNRRIPAWATFRVLGRFFKHRETARSTRKLLVFLTPYVIGPSEVPGERSD